MLEIMHVRPITLFIFISMLAWSLPSISCAATIFFAQTDASVQSTVAPVGNSGVAQVFVPAVSGNIKSIAIRTVPGGGNGSIDCSRTIENAFNQTNPMRLAIWPANATSSQPTGLRADYAWFFASSTPPDADGNCFYNFYRTNNLYNSPYPPYTSSSGGTLIDGALIAGQTYMVAIDDEIMRWQGDFFGGSASGSGSGYINWIRTPDYNPASDGHFIPGNVGVGSYFMTISDTFSYAADHNVGISGTTTPATAPTISLLGSATTTAEFGATYTDSGASASDTVDGDLTSAIQITGSVDTSVMGTTTLTYVVTNSSGLSATTTRAVVVACTHDCYSNVLFLPGIKGSHLYRPKDGCDASLSSCEDRLWEPGLDEGIFSSLLRGAGNDDVRDLFLNAQGASARSDIYVKEKDILDSVSGKDFYASFIADMDALKADGTIVDWEPVAYDWRLSLADIVQKGKKTGNHISYLKATSTPYIEQELRRLAASSRTGKVTIVAHSNGGLVAKALLNQLGGSTSKSLVDNLIFVGVPQSGAPRAVGSLLYGTGEGLPLESFDFLLSKSVAREFSENSPMAYHLLPSAQYFTDVNDSSHAVGEFTGTGGFVEERSAYGSILDTADELYDFLLARDGGREKPAASDVSEANVLNESLIDYARDTHLTYDAWLPPPEITLYQVAGWGVDTVAGLRFTELPPILAGPFAATHRNMFSPTFVEDGDGVVTVPSALMMSTSSPNVKRYWVDLREYNKHHTNTKHGNLFEIEELKNFIQGILEGTNSLPEFIKLTQPSSQTEDKKLVFILHSPLTLQLTDSAGNTTGLSGDDVVTENISGATYGEFGDAKYIIAPEGSYTLTMDGQEEGTFTLEMQEMSGNDVTSSAVIANAPATPSTLASLTIYGGLETASALTVDKNGDGGVIKVTPKAGETVNYIEPRRTLWRPSPVAQPANTDAAPEPPVAATPAADVWPISASSSDSVASTSPVRESAPEAVVQIEKKAPEIIAIDKKKSAPQNSVTSVASEKKTDKSVPQTASVYDASQQQVLHKLGAVVYNSLQRLLRGFKRMLLLEI